MVEHFNDPERMRQVEKFVLETSQVCCRAIELCRGNTSKLSGELETICLRIQFKTRQYHHWVLDEDCCNDGDVLSEIQSQITITSLEIKELLLLASVLCDRLERGEI